MKSNLKVKMHLFLKLIITAYLMTMSIETYGQSKKKQIKLLKAKIDSLTTLQAIEGIEYTLNLKIQGNKADSMINKIKVLESILNRKNDSLENIIAIKNKLEISLSKENEMNKILNDTIKFHAKTIEDLNIEIENINSKLKSIETQFDEKNKLIGSLENKYNLINSTSVSYFDSKYSFIVERLYGSNEISSDDFFMANMDTIIKKEKNRINQSKYCRRKNKELVINSKINRLSLNHYSENQGNYEMHYAFLFEDTTCQKAYISKIEISYPGAGIQFYSLDEIDLNNGKAFTVVKNIGGEYHFNNNNSYIAVCGWYDNGDLLNCDSKFKLINLKNKKTELEFKNTEVVNFKWISENKFECQLINYSYESSTEDGWPVELKRETNRSIPFNTFTLINNKWIISE